MQKLGMLDRPILYPINDSIKIGVPVSRIRLDEVDLAQYEVGFIKKLAEITTSLHVPMTLVDGGADIGIFSLKLLSLCPCLQRIVAFEPNYLSYLDLKANLDRLPVAVQAIPKALADFEGFGDLEMPPANIAEFSELALDHASRFITSSPSGLISVTTIDLSVAAPRENIVIKLDIEGGELAALRGAAHTVQSASNIIVAIEAHPLVTKRTGIDPVECLRLLSTWRNFSFIVAETGVPVNIKLPVFSQLPPQIYNLICISATSP